MEKIDLLPNVAVYSNVFSDLKSVLNAILQSQKSSSDGKFYINEWAQWGHSGKSTQINDSIFRINEGSFFHQGDSLDSCVYPQDGWLLKEYDDENYHTCKNEVFEYLDSDIVNFLTKNYDEFLSNTDAILQRKMLKEITNCYQKVLLDYSRNYGHNFDFFDNNLGYTNISLLHHQKTPEDFIMSMPYHTDTHQFDQERGGQHFLLTITMYLNDDYDGGELSFLNEETSEVIHYRPKAGDITVFPSDKPYWHGVEKIKSGDRYVVRTFLSKNRLPSESWLENSKIYGEETWIKMENDRVKKAWNEPQYFKIAVYEDDLDKVEYTEDGFVVIGKMKGKPFFVNKKRAYYED
jgi:hypothetical protein